MDDNVAMTQVGKLDAVQPMIPGSRGLQHVWNKLIVLFGFAKRRATRVDIA